jgi:hypothetical protein
VARLFLRLNEGKNMPERETVERAERDKREGKAASTQAGEFIREEMHHIREGKHGARSPQQAIAIGLSKARRAGVALAAPKKGRYAKEVSKQAEHDLAKGRSHGRGRVSRKRSRAVEGALKKESHRAASKSALSRHARSAARKRGHAALHNAAMKAVRTKGKSGLRRAGQKAARTRGRSHR